MWYSSQMSSATCHYTTIGTCDILRDTRAGKILLFMCYHVVCARFSMCTGRKLHWGAWLAVAHMPSGCYWGRVTALNVSPVNDSFLSAATDGTVRLWDLRSANCQVNSSLPVVLPSIQRPSHSLSTHKHAHGLTISCMQLVGAGHFLVAGSGPHVCSLITPLLFLSFVPLQGALNVVPGQAPVASFDPDGLVFAAGINSKQIKLYDARKFEQGPFTTFDKHSFLPETSRGAWTCESGHRAQPS